MLIFDWIRRQFAEATEAGIKDGLKNSGFIQGEADDSRLVLWLSNGDVKELPAKAATEGKGRGR